MIFKILIFQAISAFRTCVAILQLLQNWHTLLWQEHQLTQLTCLIRIRYTFAGIFIPLHLHFANFVFFYYFRIVWCWAYFFLRVSILYFFYLIYFFCSFGILIWTQKCILHFFLASFLLSIFFLFSLRFSRAHTTLQFYNFTLKWQQRKKSALLHILISAYVLSSCCHKGNS